MDIDTTKEGVTDERAFPGRHVIRYSKSFHRDIRDVGQRNLSKMANSPATIHR